MSTVSLSGALDALAELEWVLLCAVVVHAAVQVRKYQDTYPRSGLEHAARGILATVWFGVGSALAQAAILSESVETIYLPVGVCVLAYLATTFFPSDLVFRGAQNTAVNAVLIIGLEICRALCVGVGVSSALKVYSNNPPMAIFMGVLRGTWGWAVGRPGAKVILGASVRDMSWPTPPVSAVASSIAAVLLVLATSREEAEMVIGVLIAVLVAWRSYDLFTTSS